MHAEGDADAAPDPGAAPQAPAGIEEALRSLGAEGRAGLQATVDAARSLRHLVAADIALARSALARTLVLAGIAIAFAASSWLLLMATMIAAMRVAGLSWLLALLVAAMLSLIVTAAAAWGAARYFKHTRLQATRRQLARLGFGELAELLGNAGKAQGAPAVGTPETAWDPGKTGDSA
jgi:uncharacterized membrane protein YqjE